MNEREALEKIGNIVGRPTTNYASKGLQLEQQTAKLDEVFKVVSETLVSNKDLADRLEKTLVRYEGAVNEVEREGNDGDGAGGGPVRTSCRTHAGKTQPMKLKDGRTIKPEKTDMAASHTAIVGAIQSAGRPFSDRELVLDILRRMRESEQEARMAEAFGKQVRADIWRARARAFNECYTELKGRGYSNK